MIWRLLVRILTGERRAHGHGFAASAVALRRVRSHRHGVGGVGPQLSEQDLLQRRQKAPSAAKSLLIPCPIRTDYVLESGIKK